MEQETLQLEAGETVIAVIHRHWLILFTQLFGLAVFALTPFLGWLIAVTASASLPTLTVNFTDFTTHFIFFYSCWLLYTLMAVAHTLANHYLDVWTLTNRRIIAVDQQGFFKRHLGSFRLDKVQDINVQITGIVATLLDYGSLEVETAAGTTGEFRAYNLPHPRQLKNLILETCQQLEG